MVSSVKSPSGATPVGLTLMSFCGSAAGGSNIFMVKGGIPPCSRGVTSATLVMGPGPGAGNKTLAGLFKACLGDGDCRRSGSPLLKTSFLVMVVGQRMEGYDVLLAAQEMFGIVELVAMLGTLVGDFNDIAWPKLPALEE